jgi:hypothetical protein
MVRHTDWEKHKQRRARFELILVPLGKIITNWRKYDETVTVYTVNVIHVTTDTMYYAYYIYIRGESMQ